MKLRCLVFLLAPVLFMVGCSGRSNSAYIEIEDDQTGMGSRAEPIFVDPGVEVIGNEYRRSSLNDGSNILQKIKIRGPIMIVPAPGAATRPMSPR